jgi:hypothetical protein
MNIKRAFLVLAAALLMPGLALAQDFGPATFQVDFNFEDGNDWDETMARISCTGGLPLDNQQVVRHGSELNFVLTFADEGPGLAECFITIDDVPGYRSTYLATGDSEHIPELSLINCFFNNVSDGHENLCVINMEVEPVVVAVTKEWIVDRTGGDVIDPHTSILVSSDAPIYRGDDDPHYNYCNFKDTASEQNGLMEEMYCLTLYFDGEETEFVNVIPSHEGDTVYFYEHIYDSAVEASNTCGIGVTGSVIVFPGKGASCTFTNTVFFEGIPTLNRYSLALLALLMLGIGAVGFRRFS